MALAKRGLMTISRRHSNAYENLKKERLTKNLIGILCAPFEGERAGILAATIGISLKASETRRRRATRTSDAVCD